MLFFIIVVILLVVYRYIEIKYSYQDKNKDKRVYHYNQKMFMTQNERYFYNIFKELENELNIIIHPQTNLASIIDKSSGKYRNELFRNIDFAVFTKNYEELLFLIEINDKTHQKYKRRKRDNNVKNICNDANIQLITFDTKYNNTRGYIINRIKSIYLEIQNKNNNCDNKEN